MLESLPYASRLRPFTGELSFDGEHAEIHLDGAELAEAVASGSRFAECAITGTTFDGGDFDHVRLAEVWVSRCRWIGGNWAESQLLDTRIEDSVLAGVQSYRAYWRRVVVRDSKIDSLNLRAAKLQDVEFRDCDLSEVDFGDATLINVTFPGSAVRRARFTKVTTKKVDFRGARELDVAQGWESLRGVTIDSHQLIEAAPALAHTMGIVVEDR